MRTKQTFKTLKNSQKIRVLVNGVQVHTTVQETVGIVFNLLKTLDSERLEDKKANFPILTSGIVERYNENNVQVDLI